MFSKLLKSEARKKLLKIFTENSREKYYLRELAGMIQYSPGSLQRELNGLVGDDILLAEKVGNLRFFSLNSKNPYIKNLKLYLASHPEPDQESSSTQGKKIASAQAKPKLKAQSAVKPQKQVSRQGQKQPQETPVTPGMKPDTKPVLEARPWIITRDSLENSASKPQSDSEGFVREEFLPAPAPIQPPVAYTPTISPFSKPVLTKPDIQKPEIYTQNSKPETESDYPKPLPEPAFDYDIFPAEDDTVDFADTPANQNDNEPLSYQPEPTIQNNQSGEPPEEANGDIRLHIE